jgi:hypothetical protein
MAAKDREEELDRQIARAIDPASPRFDPEAWKAKYAKEVNQLAAGVIISKDPIGRHIQWRTIMQSRVTKFSAAAAVLMIGAALFLLRPQSAWALDKTLEALKDVRNVYISGKMRYPGEATASMTFEQWIRPSDQDPNLSGDLRHSEGNSHLFVENEQENRTYVYEAKDPVLGEVVYISEGINRARTLIPNGNWLEGFGKNTANWKEEYIQDRNGQPLVRITCEGNPLNTARFWRIDIDLATNLPVRAGVWFDERREGDAHTEFDVLRYNVDIPADFFSFKIPANATVYDCPAIRQQIDRTPDCGMEVQSTTEESIRRVVDAYGRALVAQDWQAARTLRPILAEARWQSLQDQYKAKAKIASFKITGLNHIGDPGVFTQVKTRITFEDGTGEDYVLHVEIRPRRQGLVGVIVDPIP